MNGKHVLSLVLLGLLVVAQFELSEACLKCGLDNCRCCCVSGTGCANGNGGGTGGGTRGGTRGGTGGNANVKVQAIGKSQASGKSNAGLCNCCEAYSRGGSCSQNCDKKVEKAAPTGQQCICYC